MKITLKIGLFLAIVAAVFTGCSDDNDYSLGKVWISYGTIVGESSPHIQLDNGSILYISANNIPYVKLVDNERVVVNYTILGDVPDSGTVKDYYIMLNGLYSFLAKDYTDQKDIDESEDPEHFRDSLGYDPIVVRDHWFGGKYLNIEFAVARQYGSSTVHYINMLYDPEVKGENGEVVLKLLHNDNGDGPNLNGEGNAGKTYVYSKSLVSFNIEKLAQDNGGSVDIILIWEEFADTNWNETVTKSAKGTFVPYQGNLAKTSTNDATTQEVYIQ